MGILIGFAAGFVTAWVGKDKLIEIWARWINK